MIRAARLALPVLLAVAVFGAVSATTASNSVPGGRVGNPSRTVGANDLKPAQCASLTLTALVTGSGTINGGAASELIIGSSAVDTISGSGGNDCLVGGAGNDSLAGGAGTDVCIGGLGTDTFNNNCETKIQ